MDFSLKGSRDEIGNYQLPDHIHSHSDDFNAAFDAVAILPLHIPGDSPIEAPMTPETPHSPVQLEGKLGDNLAVIYATRPNWMPVEELIPIPDDREAILKGRPPDQSERMNLTLHMFNSTQSCLAAAVASLEEECPGSSDSKSALAFLQVMTQRTYERDIVSKVLKYDIQSKIEIDAWNEYVNELQQVKNRMDTELEKRISEANVQKKLMGDFVIAVKQAQEAVQNDLDSALKFSSDAQDRLHSVQSDLENESYDLSSPLSVTNVVRRDITIVSKVVLKRIVMFLKPKEFVTCFRVCKRWRVALDVGYLWKTVFAQSVRQLKRKLQRMEEERQARLDLETAIPKAATIPLLGLNVKKAKSGISKSEIYEMSLTQIRAQAESAKSEHEDLTQQATARQEVHQFLEKGIKDARGKYGEALAGRATAEARLAQLQRRKEETALAVSELEEAIREEAETQTEIQSRLSVSIADVEHRLNVLTEDNMATSSLHQTRERAESLGLNITAAVSGDNEGIELSLSGEQLIEKLTDHKRKLVKNVKSLMHEIDQGSQLADALCEALRKLGANPPPPPPADYKGKGNSR